MKIRQIVFWQKKKQHIIRPDTRMMPLTLYFSANLMAASAPELWPMITVSSSHSICSRMNGIHMDSLAVMGSGMFRKSHETFSILLICLCAQPYQFAWKMSPAPLPGIMATFIFSLLKNCRGFINSESSNPPCNKSRMIVHHYLKYSKITCFIVLKIFQFFFLYIIFLTIFYLWCKLLKVIYKWRKKHWNSLPA